MLVADERISLQHRLESPGAGPDLGELPQMIADLPLMPCRQDRLDVGEVLVERRPADPGVLSNLGHRDPGQPALGHQRGGHIERRRPPGVAMRRDAVVPQLRHGSHPTWTRCWYSRHSVLKKEAWVCRSWRGTPTPSVRRGTSSGWAGTSGISRVG